VALTLYFTTLFAAFPDPHVSALSNKRTLTPLQVGVIGTGLIGKKCVQKISGLCQKVLCFDAYPSHDWIATIPNAEYVELDNLLENSNIISIHVPLLKETHHLINKDTIAKMKKHVILINTSRGEIVNTPDLIEGLKNKTIFGAALDVFEGEKAFIFKDMTEEGFKALPELKTLTEMHNVIVSSHVAFYTDESIRQITEKTLSNFEGFEGSKELDEKSFVA
jgi:D-lactate dehydrogenase